MDLHVCTKENALANLELYQILVDKDGILPYPQETDDKKYWVKEPQEIEFQCACSDFWWCLNNVAKGLWRNELPYAMDVINFVLRPHLKRLLEWEIGIEHNFSVSAGKSGKYFKKYFLGKNINEAMYKTSQDIITNLAAMQTQIGMFIDSLSVLRKDKKFFNKLDEQTQWRIRSNIIGYKLISRDLDKILKPILKGLQEE